MHLELACWPSHMYSRSKCSRSDLYGCNKTTSRICLRVMEWWKYLKARTATEEVLSSTPTCTALVVQSIRSPYVYLPFQNQMWNFTGIPQWHPPIVLQTNVHVQPTENCIYPVPQVNMKRSLEFFPRAIILWNSLPKNSHDAKTLPIFKRRLRDHLKL